MNPLVSFAEAVLGILAADKDWGGDTLDSISSTAHALGLATTGEEGCFSIAPAPAPAQPPSSVSIGRYTTIPGTRA